MRMLWWKVGEGPGWQCYPDALAVIDLDQVRAETTWSVLSWRKMDEGEHLDGDPGGNGEKSQSPGLERERFQTVSSFPA